MSNITQLHTPNSPQTAETTVRQPAKVVPILNQKGGVGKTTTAMNLSTALAACGHAVLVVDFDPQGNATTGFGVPKEDATENNVYSLLMGKDTLPSCIRSTDVPNLELIPSTIHLSGAEVELVNVIAREQKLKEALESARMAYDYIIIDCPPSLGLLTVNALVASTDVLVPMQCEFFALEGMSQLFNTIDLVRKALNPDLNLLGVLLTMVDKRNKLTGQVENEVRDYLGQKVFETMIPRNVRLSEAPSHGRPGLLYDLQCPGSQAYIQLAGEVINRFSPEEQTEQKEAA